MHQYRLVHCLLLGHVRSIPTLEELRSMRRAFTLKAPVVSQTPTEGALKIQSTTKEVRPEGDSISPVASASARVSTSGPSVSGSALATLRIAQRRFQAVPLWFERHENDERFSSGRDSGDDWLSSIRAVYSAAWGGGDGRVDVMDLLLALCYVPSDTIARGVDGSRVAEDGVEDTGELLRCYQK